MYVLISNAGYPLRHVSCGTLESSGGFVHPRRNLDTFVLIVVKAGVLHITTDGRSYDAGPGHAVLLLAGKNHCGSRPSTGRLSYDWVHFTVDDPDYTVENLANPAGKAFEHGADLPERYLIPECFKITFAEKVNVLFAQMVDLSRSMNYMRSCRCDYALSLLALSLTNDRLRASGLPEEAPAGIIGSIEYIRRHYNRPISVAALAGQYDYNVSYFSRIFKQHTGCSLTSYINKTRITAAKNLLVATNEPLKQIAGMCGIPNEKYFMKIFRELEGMTPSQYRRAFRLKHIVD
jgi:AraC-like DNA-binding protein